MRRPGQDTARNKFLSKPQLKAGRDRLIRLIRAHPDPLPRPSRCSEDDFAIRRGHKYTTILIDLATHRPIDVLPTASPRRSQSHLHRVLTEYIGHYNRGRSRQGHGRALRALNDDATVLRLPLRTDRIRQRQLLGGLLNERQPAA